PMRTRRPSRQTAASRRRVGRPLCSHAAPRCSAGARAGSRSDGNERDTTMKRFAMTTGALVLLASATAGCGADPMLGTFSYTQSAAYTQTAPQAGSYGGMDTGNFTVTEGATSDYVLSAMGTNGGNCVLNAMQAPNLGLTILANQTCSFRANNTTTT